MLSLNTVLLVSVFLMVVNGHDTKGRKELAQAVGVPVGRRLGGRLVTTLVATINPIIFFYFFPFFFLFSPSSTFLIEGVLGSKNLFRES